MKVNLDVNLDLGENEPLFGGKPPRVRERAGVNPGTLKDSGGTRHAAGPMSMQPGWGSFPGTFLPCRTDDQAARIVAVYEPYGQRGSDTDT